MTIGSLADRLPEKAVTGSPLVILITHIALHLASVASLAAVAWLIGLAILQSRRVGLRAEPVLAAALGWGLVGQILFCLGLLGLLQAPFIWGVFGLAILLCHRTWRPALSLSFDWCRQHRRILPGLCVALAPIIALGLYPPTGFDSTLYHLPYARAFAESGSLEFLPTLRFPIFPQLAEVTFVPAMLAGSDVAAKLTQVWSLFLTAGILLVWGRQRGSTRAGIWAAALWIGTPLAIWIGSKAYVDAGLTLFITAGLYAFDRYRQTRAARFLALAGAFLGFAAATKYLALFFIVYLGLWTVARDLRSESPSRLSLRPAVIFSAMVLLLAAPWYLRIYLATGSPLFPFYEPIFGANDWSSFHDKVAFGSAEQATTSNAAKLVDQLERAVEGIGFLIMTPWLAVADRGVFNWQAPLTPLYLLLIPSCIPLILRRASGRLWAGLLLCYGLFWLTTIRDLRFLLAVLPLLNLLLAQGLDQRVAVFGGTSLKSTKIPLTALGMVALAAPGLLYGIYKLHELGPIPATAEERRQHLSQRLAGYDALVELNRSHGSGYTVYGLFAENLRYFADGVYIGDWSGPDSYPQIIPLLKDGQSLHRRLRELQVDYLLVKPRPGASSTDFDLPEALFAPKIVDSSFQVYRLAGSAASGHRP